MKFVLATLAAIAVQPLWFFMWLGVPALLDDGTAFRVSDVPGLGAMALLAMTVATPFVLLIGLPSGLLLRHAPRRGLWLGLIGFAAALPMAVDWPWRGLPSLRNFETLLPLFVAGAHGLFGALAFHATLRWFERDVEAVRRP